MNKIFRLFSFFAFYIRLFFVNSTYASVEEEIARTFLRKMEDLAKEIRNEIINANKLRCESLQECGGKNYNDCSSEFPNPTCSNNPTSLCKECGCKCVDDCLKIILLTLSYKKFFMRILLFICSKSSCSNDLSITEIIFK